MRNDICITEEQIKKGKLDNLPKSLLRNENILKT